MRTSNVDAAHRWPTSITSSPDRELPQLRGDHDRQGCHPHHHRREGRKQANELSKRGLLDQEEALGWYVCDTFNTIFPSDISWSAMRSGRVGWCGPLWALSPAPLPTVRALWAAQPTRMVGPGSNLAAEDLPGAR